MEILKPVDTKLINITNAHQHLDTKGHRVVPTIKDLLCSRSYPF